MRVVGCLFIIILAIALFYPLPVPSSAKFRLFKPSSSLIITPEHNDLGVVKPGSSASTAICVTYSFGRFSRPKGFFLYENPTRINLYVKNKPEWCEVYLDKKSFSVDIPISAFLFGGNQTFLTNLTVKVKKWAPGYVKGLITIAATAEENGNIPKAEGMCSITIKADFVPDVSIKINKPFLYLESGGNDIVLINVTNKSNMDIEVSLEKKSNVSLLSLDLPSNETVRINETKSLQVTVHAGNTERTREVAVPLRIIYKAKAEGVQSEVIEKIRVIVKGRKIEGLSAYLPPIILVLVIVVIAAVAAIKKYKK